MCKVARGFIKPVAVLSVLFVLFSVQAFADTAGISENTNWTKDILRMRAEEIAGEFNHVADNVQSYVNFMAYLDGMDDMSIRRPMLDMRNFNLDWLQNVPSESELDDRITGTEIIGEHPGKALLMTGRRDFSDRIEPFRGQAVDLLQYEVLSQFSDVLSVCVGRRIESGLAKQFGGKYLVRRIGDDYYACRFAVVPTGYGKAEIEGFLTTSGGDVSGILDGSGIRINADFLKLGDEERTKANTSSLYELLIGLFEKNMLDFAELPPEIESLHASLYARYGKEIVDRSGSAALHRALLADSELRAFLDYVRARYVTSQEVNEKLDAISGFTVNGKDIKTIVTNAAKRYIENGDVFEKKYSLGNIIFDENAPPVVEIDLTWDVDKFVVRDLEIIGTEASPWTSPFKTLRGKYFGIIPSSGNIDGQIYNNTGDIVFTGLDDVNISSGELSERLTVHRATTFKSQEKLLLSGDSFSFTSPDDNIMQIRTDNTSKSGIFVWSSVTFDVPPTYAYTPVSSSTVNFMHVNEAIKDYTGADLLRYDSENGELEISNFNMTGTVTYAADGSSSYGIKLNGKAVVTRRIESVDISEANKFIPIHVFGIEKNAITEGEKEGFAGHIKANLWNTTPTNISNYLYGAVDTRFIHKASPFVQISGTTTKTFTLPTSLLCSYFTSEYASGVNDMLKDIDEDFDVSQIKSFIGRYYYKVDGSLVPFSNQVLFRSNATATFPDSGEYLFFKNALFDGESVKLRNGADEAFINYTKVSLDTNPRILQSYKDNFKPGSYKTSDGLYPKYKYEIVDVDTFESIEMDESLLYQYGDDRLAMFPSFKLYLQPEIVFLAR
jgi:hypothetical protein